MIKEPFDVVEFFNMTDEEAKAYNVALIWQEQTKKLFPNDKIAKLPYKKDPRKCTLFRYCWKMCRETRGLLSEEESRLFIIGNLQILKAHRSRIDPNVICGDKAWLRWLVWKRLYNKKMAEMNHGEPPLETHIPAKIIKEIMFTKKFLYEKCDGNPTFDQIKTFLDNGNFRSWIIANKVSVYYILLSPWINQICNLDELERSYGYDSALYTEKLDDYITRFFQKEFEHENQTMNLDI